MTKRIALLRTRWSAALGLGALVAAVAALAGCATIKREQLRIDSPWLSSAPASNQVCAREESGKLRVLEPGGSCYALVRAADWYSTTNVGVQPGSAVEVVVPSGQLWFDASRINTAPYGDDGNFLMKLFGGMTLPLSDVVHSHSVTRLCCSGPRASWLRSSWG